jgi:hypothetical protein
MNPDRRMAKDLQGSTESGGDTLADLQLWRLGPGHLGAIVPVGTRAERRPNYYRAKLARFQLSQLTIEVQAEFMTARRAGAECVPGPGLLRYARNDMSSG